MSSATRSFGRQLYATKKQAWFQDAAPKKLYLNKEEAAGAWALVTSRANTANKYGGFIYWLRADKAYSMGKKKKKGRKEEEKKKKRERKKKEEMERNRPRRGTKPRTSTRGQ